MNLRQFFTGRTICFLIPVVLLAGYFLFFNMPAENITDFESCAKAGNPVMESYPRQCAVNGKTYVEYVGDELEKRDLIRISSPRPNTEIASPLVIQGEARGVWFFEGSFPIILTDWDGRIIAESFASARGEWMTEEFVSFTGEIMFEKPVYGERGTLILQKDNPSGLPEHDDALEISIVFGEQKDAQKVVSCGSEQRNIDVCTAIYQPVCGTVNVQCVTSPCPPIHETFSNSCVACANSLVESYTEGECVAR